MEKGRLKIPNIRFGRNAQSTFSDDLISFQERQDNLHKHKSCFPVRFAAMLYFVPSNQMYGTAMASSAAKCRKKLKTFNTVMLLLLLAATMLLDRDALYIVGFTGGVGTANPVEVAQLQQKAASVAQMFQYALLAVNAAALVAVWLDKNMVKGLFLLAAVCLLEYLVGLGLFWNIVAATLAEDWLNIMPLLLLYAVLVCVNVFLYFRSLRHRG